MHRNAGIFSAERIGLEESQIRKLVKFILLKVHPK